jgi:hypothetical protein
MNTQRAVLATEGIRSKKTCFTTSIIMLGVCHVWRTWTVVFIPWAVSAVADPPQATGSLVGQPGQHSLNIYEYIRHQ